MRYVEEYIELYKSGQLILNEERIKLIKKSTKKFEPLGSNFILVEQELVPQLNK